MSTIPAFALPYPGISIIFELHTHIADFQTIRPRTLKIVKSIRIAVENSRIRLCNRFPLRFRRRRSNGDRSTVFLRPVEKSIRPALYTPWL